MSGLSGFPHWFRGGGLKACSYIIPGGGMCGAPRSQHPNPPAPQLHTFQDSGDPDEGLCLYVYGDGSVCNTSRKSHPQPMPIIEKMFVDPEEPQYFPGDARAVWRAHSDMVKAKLEEKVGYGSAWIEQGYMGNLARILSKASRVKNMLWKDDCGPDLQMGSEESVLDTLMDLSALCALAIANIEEGNRWGR